MDCIWTVQYHVELNINVWISFVTRLYHLFVRSPLPVVENLFLRTSCFLNNRFESIACFLCVSRKWGVNDWILVSYGSIVYIVSLENGSLFKIWALFVCGVFNAYVPCVWWLFFIKNVFISSFKFCLVPVQSICHVYFPQFLAITLMKNYYIIAVQ